jgi:hypothetical protein
MRHVVGEPSPKVRELARALIDRPRGPIQADDEVLAAAVRAVIAGLDSYDMELISRTASQPPDSAARHSLELALAHRIVVAAIDLEGKVEELIEDGHLPRGESSV